MAEDTENAHTYTRARTHSALCCCGASSSQPLHGGRWEATRARQRSTEPKPRHGHGERDVSSIYILLCTEVGDRQIGDDIVYKLGVGERCRIDC